MSPIRSLSIATVLAVMIGGLAAAQVDRVEDLAFPPLPEVEIPQPERHVLDNGLVVMLLEDHELPLIEARMIVRTGSRWEPVEKVGLAGLTGDVLRSGGTTTLRSDDLDDLLEDRAAVIETSIGLTSGNAVMSCLTDDFTEILALFADLLRHPAFEEEKLEVAKNQLVASIARQNDDPQQILAREFSEIIYGADSPYAASPTYESVGSVTRDDLVDWHRRYFQADRMILGLVGDFDSASALQLVRETLGSWPRGEALSPPAAPYREAASPGVYHVAKDDVTQSYIRLGHPGILRNNPDYHAVEVMNNVLSGSFASRLFSNVRSTKGLAYAVRGSVGSGWDYPGITSLSMSTKTETTMAGIEALLEEARGMRERPPTEEEVADAKRAILSSFVFNYASSGAILSQQLQLEYYGYPLDWLERYRRGVEAVTLEEVRAAARRYLHPERFAILVVGKEEGLDRPLGELGEVTQVDITIPEPRETEIELTETDKAQGHELIAKAIEAVGGAARLDAVRNLTSAAAAELQTPNGAMTAQVTTTIVFPDKMRSEIALPFGLLVRAIDGQAGFVQSPQGTMPMADSDRADMQRQLRRHLVTLLRHRRDPAFTAAAVGEEVVGEARVVLVRTDLDGEATTLGIDPEDGRVLSMTYRGSGLNGAPGTLRVVHSDFRQTGGLRLPHQADTTFEGEPMVSITTESIVVDGTVEEAAFRPPKGDS